ncbi:hypothetical protein A3752_14750 [Oleiphilus sp. HI0081]|uniref:hypothetical protein n=1 Tax=Oleiphilus sp. HI0132 TaxID=1822270 RepID=UPI0007C25323|nr:hypothetical protein [Oleiphilus sp. HI0132]KZY92131.1 hypothetical protein A3743_06780 [Oleiphilus sp. HI0072]KZZ06512.1 hypothetical protein A3749_16935 [Oleiphilus sp. HI0078]KZZ19385.1 hypothetical protein A3752_14750 [Oleiphilus sp. HI0081]KZZ75353.1 hypothetical protein A3766_16935 [Oleiphilus sp. HI0132]KZZ79110.1 hypothetical protein A3766_26935 [Oleiphilus sp. HI0132]
MFRWLKEKIISATKQQPTHLTKDVPPSSTKSVTIPRDPIPTSPWTDLDASWSTLSEIIQHQVEEADQRADKRLRQGGIHGHFNPGRDMSVGVSRLRREIEEYRFDECSSPGDNAYALLEEARKLGEGVKRYDEDGFESDAILFTVKLIHKQIEQELGSEREIQNN